MKNTQTNDITLTKLLQFILPSTIGIMLFMIPLPLGDGITIPVAFFAKTISTSLENYLPSIATMVIVFSAAASLITKIFKPKLILDNKFLNSLFNISTIWLVSRVIGAILVICANFELVSEMIYSDDTGRMILTSLLPTLFAVFLFAGLLLPLILEFGLLEFIGTFLSKIMRPLFKLPGRSAIDCITSWLGDGTVGVLLTNKQYEEGYYTKKESAIIGTSFSAVSITFALVVLDEVQLSSMFFPFYITVTIAGVVAAIVTCRIPPLRNKPDTYVSEALKKEETLVPAGTSYLKFALSKAVEKASSNSKPSALVMDGVKNVLDLWIGVTPIIMAFGTIALILATYTPIFEWLGLPFIPLLELLQIPEATAASQTLVIGFADMFLPSILAREIASEMTRFIIAALSVTQLIYMSEVGGLLLGSKIPVSFKDLFMIFILRTLITLPVITLCAYVIF